MAVIELVRGNPTRTFNFQISEADGEGLKIGDVIHGATVFGIDLKRTKVNLCYSESPTNCVECKATDCPLKKLA